jgi:hypothetical protein
MMEPLVNFPDFCPIGYTDMGEGGLYSMLVVPEPEDWTNNCHVDVQTFLTRPDAPVTADLNRQVWEPSNHGADGDWMIQSRVLTHFGRDKGECADNAAWQWVARVTNPSDLSYACLASVFLGSIPWSLYNEHEGHFWYAQYEDLTQAGKAVYNGLKAAYGVEPLLFTFLDT